MRAEGALPYAERPHRGLVRALQGVVERETQRVQLVVVCNEASLDAARPLLDRVAASEAEGGLGARLHSLWWNGNPERTNTILGPAWARVCGPEAVRERIGEAQVFFPPGAFGQANLGLADRLVERVCAWVPRDLRVVEFYAGSGAFGLSLAARGPVVLNEIAPGGLRGLELGIAALPEARRARVRVEPGSAGDRAALVAEADVVLVDPPRKGLDAPLRDALCRVRPPRLVYVSCDVASLERDLSALEDAYAIEEIVAFAMFPFTEHVETLVRLAART